MNALSILMQATIAVIVAALVYGIARFIWAAIRFQRRHNHNAETADARARMAEIEARAELRKAAPDETHEDGPHTAAARDHAETIVIRWLCSPLTDAKSRFEVANQLAGCMFVDSSRQVLIECLAEIPAVAVPDLRTELASRLTRSGFPDVTLTTYFEPTRNEATREEIETLIETIARESSESSE